MQGVRKIKYRNEKTGPLYAGRLLFYTDCTPYKELLLKLSAAHGAVVEAHLVGGVAAGAVEGGQFAQGGEVAVDGDFIDGVVTVHVNHHQAAVVADVEAGVVGLKGRDDVVAGDVLHHVLAFAVLGGENLGIAVEAGFGETLGELTGNGDDDGRSKEASSEKKICAR